MDLMKNSILNFLRITATSETGILHILSDYGSKPWGKILNYPELDSMEFMDYYYLKENETIEQVSYKLYNDEKYWDLLLIINERDPLFGMVYTLDSLRDSVKEKIQAYNSENFSSDLPQDRLNALAEEKFVDAYYGNELNRKLKYIKKEYLPKFFMILRRDGIIT